MTTQPADEIVLALERPHPALWKYYIICAVLTGPGILVSLPYLYFRYHTLRYRFDEEGIHMKVGILFRREVNLTYARIQDIHLRSNFIQRWLGLAVALSLLSVSAWVAFGPGERECSFSLSFMSGFASEAMCRGGFATGAILVGLLVVLAVRHAATRDR